jgi:aryl-alcohol dehydrogenase-like predicted oxidoreductase
MHRDDVDYQDYQRVQKVQIPVATIIEALSDPTLRSHYQMIGLSNWETPRVDASQQVARARPELLRPVCNSPYFSLFEMGPVTIHSGGVQVTHADMLNRRFQPGVKLMTYSPLGGFSIVRPGWKPAKDRALALKNARDRYWGHAHDALFHEANAQRYRRAVAFTERFNAAHHTTYTLDQVLNAYVLAHPRTDFLVIGPRTIADLHRTVESLELARRLSPADLEFLHSGRGAVQAEPKAS